MLLNELASAIHNDILGGLRGYSSTPTMSMEQTEDEIINERLVVIKEWYYRGMLQLNDLYASINCVNVICKDQAECCNISYGVTNQYFEIPPVINDLGYNAIKFIGSLDKSTSFVIYTDVSYKYHNYRRRNADKPYVYIDLTLNKNGNHDCWIFNAPFIKVLSIIAAFKDPRKLNEFTCCDSESFLNFSSLANEIQKRLTEKKLRYYRQFLPQQSSNDQIPK